METSDPTVNPEETAAAAPEHTEAASWEASTENAEASSWDASAEQGETTATDVATEEYPPRPAGPPLKIYDQCLMESVGIEANGDFFLTMVHAGAPLGTFGGMFFSTSDDNQSEITLKVYAGTNSFASRNRPLGTYVVMGVPPAPGGDPRIEVQFTAAEDGTLEVTARDRASRQELWVEHVPVE